MTHGPAMITQLEQSSDGVWVKLAGMVAGRYVPGENLTLDGEPVDVSKLMGWWVGVRGGASATIRTAGLLDEGESADFRTGNV